jgi:hypothetical protein
MKETIAPMPSPKYARLAAALCAATAVLYNSWPLGYALNGHTARNALASDLARVGQPYYWLFALGDVLAGICVLAAVGLVRFKLWPALRSKAWSAICGGLALFGLFTIINAVPSQCPITAILRCPSGASGYLSLDAVLSSVAALGLFIGLVAVNQAASRVDHGALLRSTRYALGAWVASGLSFAVLALTNANAHLAQQLLNMFSGLALVVIGLVVVASLGRPSLR